MDISLLRRHALLGVQDGAFSDKISYGSIFVEILSLKGHLNHFIGQKGGIYLVVEFHQEGYMAAACAAGLFFFLIQQSALWYLFIFVLIRKPTDIHNHFK